MRMFNKNTRLNVNPIDWTKSFIQSNKVAERDEVNMSLAFWKTYVFSVLRSKISEKKSAFKRKSSRLLAKYEGITEQTHNWFCWS